MKFFEKTSLFGRILLVCVICMVVFIGLGGVIDKANQQWTVLSMQQVGNMGDQLPIQQQMDWLSLWVFVLQATRVLTIVGAIIFFFPVGSKITL